MRLKVALAVAVGLLLAGSAVQAQGFPGGGMGGRFPGGGGGRGGRGGVGGGMRRYQPPVDIPDMGNPVRRFILENRAELKLTDAQASSVDSLAKSLDARNDTLIAAVRRALGWDSASTARRQPRDTTGQAAPPPPDESRPDDTRLRDRMNAMKPTIKQIRTNDDEAWKAAVAVLDKDQRKQAEKLKKDSEKDHERARNRWRGGGLGPGGPEPD